MALSHASVALWVETPHLWSPTRATGRSDIKRAQSVPLPPQCLPHWALALHSSFTLCSRGKHVCQRQQVWSEIRKHRKRREGGEDDNRKGSEGKKKRIVLILYMPGCLTLYSSKLCLSKFTILARQLCTYAANSLCFSSEGVSHQARVMDSLVAGTSRWRKAPRPSTPQRSNYLPASASHHGPAWEWARGHASTPGILCRPHAHTTEQSDAHTSSHIQNKIGSHTKGCRPFPTML